MATLMHASNQWASRPSDERFTSLPALLDKVSHTREFSIGSAVSTKRIGFEPDPNNVRTGLVADVNGQPVVMNHWSFGQMAALAQMPAGLMRRLPAPLAADNMNYGLKFLRDVEDVGTLRYAPGNIADTLTAATGPRYGRIWNQEIVSALVNKFGDGVQGPWKVPGEFGKNVPITSENTTIYGSDRDMFVFLADEENRVDVHGRRNGEKGSLARGFFIWNSEVGSTSMGAAFFLFDYACSNRIVWGAKQFKEIRIRHTVSAPDRWLEEITPVLTEYANAASGTVEDTIKAAQEKKLGDDLDAFLAKRFTGRMGTLAKAAHEREEGRPIETLWDVVTGLTAHAKTIEFQDERVKLEREAGALLDLVAA